MQQQVMWIPLNKPGLEHLNIRDIADHVSANSLIIGLEKNLPFRVRYQLSSTLQSHITSIHIETLDIELPYSLSLKSDGAGHWTNPLNEPIRDLEGCLDVDMSVTPYTDMLAIQRLALNPGDAAEMRAVSISIPDLRTGVITQRITCTGRDELGAFYHYEIPAEGFVAEMRVNSHGLVDSYEDGNRNGFKRVLPQ